MRTERIDQIEEYILTNKTVTIDKLCEAFNVSKNTIRRDIGQLLDRGRIKKVYGGVTALPDSPLIPLTPYSLRNTTFESEKDLICKRAASFVEDNDLIYIDTGTTSQNLIDYLGNKKCTIITNSLQVAIKAVNYPNITLISLSGKLKRETLSFVGSTVEEALKTYNIGKAFLCCTGVTMKNGLTNASMDEYQIKKIVVENSQCRYLLADHTKFGKFSLMTYSPLSDIEHVITDQKPSADYMNFFSTHDIDLNITGE